MTDPILALRASIRARLAADPQLVTALGGAAIYDETPREAQAPYVVFGETQARAWSNGTTGGREQFVSLHIWSRAPGDREALAVAGRIATLLDEVDLTLDGHRLLIMRLLGEDTIRPGRDGLRRVTLRFYAITEQA